MLADRSDRHPLNDYRVFSVPGTGLPPTKRVKLRYSEIFRITSTAGAVGKFLFAANGMYDPNLTGAGHQPYGYDQWFTFYKTATVLASRIDVEVATSMTGLATQTLVTGVTFAESDPTVVTGSATPVGLIEANRGTTKMLIAFQPTQHLQSNFDLRAFYPDHDPADVQQPGSANPTRTYVYCVFQVPVDFTVTAIGDYVAVIEYDVLFEQPVTVATS